MSVNTAQTALVAAARISAALAGRGVASTEEATLGTAEDFYNWLESKR